MGSDPNVKQGKGRPQSAVRRNREEQEEQNEQRGWCCPRGMRPKGVHNSPLKPGVIAGGLLYKQFCNHMTELTHFLWTVSVVFSE